MWNVILHFNRGHVEHLKFNNKEDAQNSVNIAVFNNEDCINCSIYQEENVYEIYHPKNGVLNLLCKRGIYEYEKVFEVKNFNINKVFYQVQNDFNEEYARKKIRSTSIGDIIVDKSNDKHYFVSSIGFTEIPSTVTQHINWKNEK